MTPVLGVVAAVAGFVLAYQQAVRRGAVGIALAALQLMVFGALAFVDDAAYRPALGVFGLGGVAASTMVAARRRRLQDQAAQD